MTFYTLGTWSLATWSRANAQLRAGFAGSSYTCTSCAANNGDSVNSSLGTWTLGTWDLATWNTASLKEYGELVDSGRLPISGQEELTREMRLEEAFMIGLRRTCGFDIWSVARELGIKYPPAK